MNETQFNELLTRYQENRSTPQERALVERWLASFEETPFAGLNDSETSDLKNRIRLAVDQQIGSLTVVRPLWQRSFFIRVAAALLLLGGFSTALWVYTSRHVSQMVIQVVRQQVKKVILPDGSLVWLKDSSRLEYPSRFTDQQRQVRLRGEALFEVAKNAQKPFVIQSGNVITKVLGTSFHIRSRGPKTEVVVFTGKVSVTTPKRKVLLLPAQKAVFAEQPKAKEKDLTIRRLLTNEKLVYSKGTEYLMVFTDTPMREVFTRIEEKFDVRIQLEKSALNRCLLTADLTDQSLDNTLRVITETFGGTYSIRDNTVDLSGASCQY